MLVRSLNHPECALQARCAGFCCQILLRLIPTQPALGTSVPFVV
ncbi:hypothetical protein CGRA01v4_01952 [Colletotrichum graminicola]|nr:hypothetical protein CGRA01v4_01952 [Colletotrichum graminicola]